VGLQVLALRHGVTKSSPCEPAHFQKGLSRSNEKNLQQLRNGMHRALGILED
jgi:hypothetical protein